MTKYLTQKALAARYGIPSKAFGDILRKAGLKDGAEASQKAIDEGFTGELEVGTYGSFYKWNADVVGALLKETDGLEYATAEDKVVLKREKEINTFWKAAASDVREGFPDDVFLSMLNIVHIPIEEMMRGLTKTSYMRNKRMSYEMTRSLHDAYTLYATDAYNVNDDDDAKAFEYSDTDKQRMSDMCMEIFGLTLDEVIQKADYNAEHNPVWK